ncbi:MAG: glycosyltransferase family 4 protein [Bacteroidales bacterium]|nr:glycosyltransferase family 4 protein [Bacteroidales bacterium]
MIDAMGERVHPVVLFPQECPVEDYYRKRGIETIVHPFSFLIEKQRYWLVKILKNPRGSGFYKDVRTDIECCRFVKRKLSGRGISLVHTNVSVAAVGVLIARSMHVPHVWHIREMLGMYSSCITPRLWRLLLNTASARIFISNAVAESWSTRQRHSFVIYNAVVPGDRPPTTREKNKTILHCSAYLEDRKGVKTAVRAFTASGLYMQGYKLLLIGSCTEERKMALLREVGDVPQAVAAIEFVGYTNDVPQYFSQASVFLMCSPSEPLGRVTIEAMYYGCPVIGRASGGTVEIIDDRRTGYLFKDDDELPSLLNEVVSNDQSEVVSRAQKQVIDKFSESAFLPKLIEVYTGLLDK